MARDMKHINKGAHSILDKFAAEKKKSVIAACLVSLMVFMWVKTLTGKGPADAEGALTSQGMNQQQEADSELQVSFIELPEINGRHDVLSGDFFSADGWQGFSVGQIRNRNGGQVNLVSGKGTEDIVRRIANKLRLEAIELGQIPRVFINDKLLSTGDKLNVKDGNRMYECKVVGIEKNRVFLRWEKSQITLKLLEETEVVD